MHDLSIDGTMASTSTISELYMYEMIQQQSVSIGCVLIQEDTQCEVPWTASCLYNGFLLGNIDKRVSTSAHDSPEFVRYVQGALSRREHRIPIAEHVD